MTERPVSDSSTTGEFWFPGRWVGGVSLLLSPLLLLAGELVRVKYSFFFPSQLEAFEQQPGLMAVAYGLFLAGIIFMWPAVLTLVRLIGRKNPRLALWGGVLTMFGLCVRMYHAGVDNLAYWTVQFQGVETAALVVGDSYAFSYQGFYVVSTLIFSTMVGWFVLAIGAYRSGTLNLFASVALGAMGMHHSGVLKGSTWDSILIDALLCAALVPLGYRILREGPIPGYRTLLKWLLILIVLGGVFFFVGQNA